MQAKSTIEMFVLSGEQTGARTLLNNNAQVSISGQMDTDVVFRDQSIRDERINLTTKDNEVFIEVLAGDVEVQGNAVSHGKIIKVPEYSKIKIGDTIFSYGRKKHTSWHQIMDYVTKYEVSNISATQNPWLSRTTSGNAVLALFILILVAAIYMYFNIMQREVQNSNFSMLDINNINSALIENGFESLTVETTDSNQILIKGFLITNREKSNLEIFVDDNEIPAILDISTGDQLTIEVRDLYRVHGIEADVKYMDIGTVIVSTSFKNKEKLEAIKSLIYKEIPSLIELETEYIKNNRDETLESAGNYDKNDKRITMVVDGSQPYIMTSDQSKYYIGAILPTGHKIVEIENQNVTIEKMGELTTLRF